MKHLDLRDAFLKNAVCLTPLLLLITVGRCPAATWEGMDDFSSGISTSNWTIKQRNAGDMTVEGVNGHASFLVSVSSTDEQNAYIVWRGTPLASENWIVEIKGQNSAFHGEWDSQLQLAVLNNEAFKSGRVEAFVVGMNNDDGVSGVGTSWWHYPGGWTGRVRVGTTSTLFKLRLLYRSASQTIEAWHDPTASGQSWIFLDSMTLNEMSLGMAATNTFMFAILGNTDFGPIPEGEIWADDFRMTGAVALPPPLVIASSQRLTSSVSLNLAWTNNGSQCVLQNAGSVTGSWSTVSTPWTTNGGWISTFVTNSSPAQFYRLRGN